MYCLRELAELYNVLEVGIRYLSDYHFSMFCIIPRRINNFNNMPVKFVCYQMKVQATTLIAGTIKANESGRVQSVDAINKMCKKRQILACRGSFLPRSIFVQVWVW